jgi:exodeoxyribonuclease VII small subunit
MNGQAPDQAAAPDEPSFEEALTRLEEIVEELESGQMPLEEALSRFQEGVRLRAVCMKKLETAEAKIEQVLAETADMTGQDVEPEAEGTGSA